MHAIIKTGGKQIRVAVGDSIFVEKLEGNVDDKIVFDQVLCITKDDGSTKFGSPILKGAKVEGTIERQGKQAKIVVFRYRAKHNIRVKRGHRQPYTKVTINTITG